MGQMNLTSHLHNYSGRGGGIVYLVGAGPGDPSLLTLRGAELLAVADVVVYDALANPRLLKHAPTAQAIYVGKQAGTHSKTQQEINALLIEQATAGKRVVRLKGGDPFVFGRGGEECEALAAAGIPFEIVPGVTAAIAAAAYAGIPVTHREFNSSFTLITGHSKDGQVENATLNTQHSTLNDQVKEANVDWATVAKLPCVAFYMGARSLGEICARLIQHGMPADMPAATIQWGTTPRQRTVVGTVGDLPGRVAEAKIGPPAMTIIGKVVGLREKLNWFERRPLFGKTIVVTRSRDQASELSARLMELGANVIEQPTIELVANDDLSEVDAALRAAGKFDWVLFTSPAGVRFARERLFALGLDARAFGSAKIGAVGSATATALREQLALKVDVCPKEFFAQALAEEIIMTGQAAGRRFLLLRADLARPMLVEKLRSAGAAEIADVAIYRNRRVERPSAEFLEALEQKRIDWITFTSSSTAGNLLRMLGADAARALAGIRLASIGTITSETLQIAGLEPVEATRHDITGLVEAILKG